VRQRRSEKKHHETRFQRFTPFLWFNDQAEAAANFHTSIFDNSRVLGISRYNKESAQVSGRPEGSAMTVAFRVDGLDFAALNGGPVFQFDEAVSLVVHCHSRQEVDHCWNHLSASGDEKARQCGWLKDRYGVSWQVVPVQLIELLNHPDPNKASKGHVGNAADEEDRSGDLAPGGGLSRLRAVPIAWAGASIEPDRSPPRPAWQVWRWPHPSQFDMDARRRHSSAIVQMPVVGLVQQRHQPRVAPVNWVTGCLRKRLVVAICGISRRARTVQRPAICMAPRPIDGSGHTAVENPSGVVHQLGGANQKCIA